MNELDPVSDDEYPDDVLGVLATDSLSLIDEPGVVTVCPGGSDQGYDPYDTARIKVGDLFRRR